MSCSEGCSTDAMAGRDAPGRVRVLLVDDDVRFADLVSQTLDDARYEVVEVVHDGAEVAAAVEALHPDVVVLDLVMQGGNGIDVAIDLRERGSSVPVLLFSSLFDQVEAAESMAHGFGFVEKAAGVDALESAIDAVIDLRDPPRR